MADLDLDDLRLVAVAQPLSIDFASATSAGETNIKIKTQENLPAALNELSGDEDPRAH